MTEPSEVIGADDVLSQRLDGLAAAVSNAEGRIDEATLAEARDITDRASDRIRMSGEHTIVALAGATGSGKSSLFNALTDLDLAGVGVRRPTTSWALACAWGPDGAGELLSWMGVPPRHQVSRMGMLERNSADSSLEGLILLDLPDHDSTEVAHHIEMERLVTHSDLLIWVLDPQKYADAAIHERYIRKMARYGAVTLVVLNQIDRIDFGERDAALADVKRLVEADGLPDVKVLGVSATRGDGIDELRRELADRVRAKSAARERLMADITDSARAIEAKGGITATPSVDDSQRTALTETVATRAGIDHVVSSAEDASRDAMIQYSQWPVLGLLSRAGTRDLTPEIAPAQPAATDAAVRDFVDQVIANLALPWRISVRESVEPTRRGEGDTSEPVPSIASAINQAVAERGVRLGQVPTWARVARIVQWIAFAILVVGVIGAAIWVIEKVTDSDTGLLGAGESAGLATLGWIALVALAVGLLTDFAGRALAKSSAHASAEQAETSLREVVDDVMAKRVIAPVEGELQVYDRYRSGLVTALD